MEAWRHRPLERPSMDAPDAREGSGVRTRGEGSARRGWEDRPVKKIDMPLPAFCSLLFLCNPASTQWAKKKPAYLRYLAQGSGPK